MKVITLVISENGGPSSNLSFEWLDWGKGANDPLGEGFLTFLSRSEKGDSIVSFKKEDIRAMQLLVVNVPTPQVEEHPDLNDIGEV